MAKRRHTRIYEAGVAAYDGVPPTAIEKLLKAMALMIAEGTKPAREVKAELAPPKLIFSPQALYEECLARVPHIIACEPYNKLWFGRLGKKLQNTKGLLKSDLETFVSWVERGGLEFMDNATFAHVIKHWSTWLPKARQWRNSGSVGAMAVEEFMT